jgi:hypothetical protein
MHPNSCCIAITCKLNMMPILFFPEIRALYLIENIVSNGWCAYRCYGADEEMRHMSTLLGILIISSLIVHLNIDNNNTSDCSIVLTFVVALLDMCAQLCLDFKILRSTWVDLTWFHFIKVIIQIYKTYNFIKETIDVWKLYEERRLTCRTNMRLLLFLTIIVCAITMIICGDGAVRKLWG